MVRCTVFLCSLFISHFLLSAAINMHCAKIRCSCLQNISILWQIKELRIERYMFFSVYTFSNEFLEKPKNFFLSIEKCPNLQFSSLQYKIRRKKENKQKNRQKYQLHNLLSYLCIRYC